VHVNQCGATLQIECTHDLERLTLFEQV